MEVKTTCIYWAFSFISHAQNSQQQSWSFTKEPPEHKKQCRHLARNQKNTSFFFFSLFKVHAVHSIPKGISKPSCSVVGEAACSFCKLSSSSCEGMMYQCLGIKDKCLTHCSRIYKKLLPR